MYKKLIKYLFLSILNLLKICPDFKCFGSILIANGQAKGKAITQIRSSYSSDSSD